MSSGAVDLLVMATSIKIASLNPSDSPEAEAQLFMSVYRSVLPGKIAIYCSGSITTGRRFVDWLKRHRKVACAYDELPPEDRRSYDEEIVEPNVGTLRAVVEAQRRLKLTPVIDPTIIPQVRLWRQQNWVSFWLGVIDEFAQHLVLASDWEYSRGACSECVFALRKQIPVYRSDGSLWTPEDAALAIGAAIENMQTCAIDVSLFLELQSQLLRSR